MCIPYTYVKDHLQNDVLSIRSIETVLRLPENNEEENDDIHLGMVAQFVSMKYLEGISRSERVKHFASLNYVSKICSNCFQGLSLAYQNKQNLPEIYKTRLLKCLLTEGDVLKICKDLKTIQINPIFLQVLDYVSNFDHLITLYSNASLNFRRMNLHQKDVGPHNAIIYHALPFMKLFETYDYAAGLMYNWYRNIPNSEIPQESYIKKRFEEKRRMKENKPLSPQTMRAINQQHMDEGKSLLQDLKEKLNEILIYSDEVLEAIGNLTSEEDIIPKFIAEEIITLNNLPILIGSHQYYILIAEIVIAHYVLHNKIEELIIILTTIQSFYGNFYLSNKVFNKNQKPLGFLVYELHSEFQPLPGPFILDIIQDYFVRIQKSETEKERILLMKYLDSLLAAITFSLNLITHLPAEKSKARYNFLLQKLFLFKKENNEIIKDGGSIKEAMEIEELKVEETQQEKSQLGNGDHKNIKINPSSVQNQFPELLGFEELKEYETPGTPRNKKEENLKKRDKLKEIEKMDEPEFLKLLELSLELLGTLRRNFEDTAETKIFSMHDKYQNYEYFQHNIFENLLQILSGVSEELKAKGEHAVFEFNGVVAGCQLIYRALDQYILKTVQSFHLFDNYITCRELEICMWGVWCMKERPQNQFFDLLAICFRKFEEIVMISMEESFVDRIKKSSNPQSLIEKHHAFLRFLNRNIIFVFKTADQNDKDALQALQSLILETQLINYLVEKSENLQEEEWITQEIHRFCTGELLTLIVNCKLRQFENEDHSKLIQALDKSKNLLLFHMNKYQLFEFASSLFENFSLRKEIPKIIPEFLPKIFTEVLPDIQIHDSQLHISILNFGLPPIFSTLNFSQQIDNSIGFQCSVGCILGLMKNLGQSIENMQQEFLNYCFNKNLENQKLRNEATIAKLGIRLLRFSKVLQNALPHFFHFINIEINEGKESNLCDLSFLMNKIIMNPLIQILPATSIETIFTIMKDIYSVNSPIFLVTTTNLIFNYFIQASKDLSDYLFQNGNQQPQTADSRLSLMNLIENFDKFWMNFYEEQVETFEFLGQKTVFALFTFNIVSQFLEKYLVNLSVSAETLMKLAENYEGMLNICLSLNLIQRLIPNIKDSQTGQFYPQERRENLYAKLVFKNITPLLIMTQTENISRSLEQFLATNLNINELLAANPDQEKYVLYKQICSFDMILNIFVEGHSFFDIFIIQDRLLQPILSWINGIILKYKTIVGTNFPKVPALDKTIGCFIKLANSSMRLLHQKNTSNNLMNVFPARINEKQYIKFIHDLFQGDFSYYEECYPNSEALDAISRGILELALFMLQYKPLHNSGDRQGNDELETLRSVESKLKEPQFFEEVYLAIKATIKRGINSNCFIYVLLRDKECQELFEGSDFHQINTWIQNMYVTTFTAITKQSCSHLEHKIKEGKNESNFLLHERDLFKCLTILEYTMEKPARVLSMVLEASEGKDIDFLDDPQEVVKNFLESFSLNTMKEMMTKPFFIPFITNYCSLLASLFRKVEVSLLVNKENEESIINEDQQNKLYEYFNLAVAHLRLHKELDLRNLIGDARTPALQEIYLFFISLWWYGQKKCLEQVASEQEVILLLLENADDDTSFELLSSFFSLYGLNAFTLETQLEILLKGLRQAGVRRINGNYRIKACQNLIDQEIVNNLRSKIEHTHHLFEEDEQKIDDTKLIITNKNGEYKLIPTHSYLLSGINPIIRKVFESIFHVYLEWFKQGAEEIFHGKLCSGKLFRPYHIIAFIMKIYPELSLYILSYPINIEKYQLQNLVKSDKQEVSFFYFLIRTSFILFPGCCMIQETLSSNRGQFIAIKLKEDGKVKLLHEVLVQLFLKEILNTVNEDLVQYDEGLFKNPQVIWKWAIYITKSFDLLFSYSSPRYMELQTQLVEDYLALIIKYITKVALNPHTNSEILMSCLLKSLQRIIETSLIRGYNSRVGKLNSKSYLYIYGKQITSSKLSKFLTFIAKKSKKNLKSFSFAQKQKSHSLHQINSHSIDILNHTNDEGININEFKNNELMIIGPKLRQSKWWSYVKQPRPERPSKAVHPSHEYLGVTENLHNQIIEEIESFSDQQPETLEFKRLVQAVKINEKAAFDWTKKFIAAIRLGWEWILEGMQSTKGLNSEKNVDSSPKALEEGGTKLFAKLLKDSLEVTEKKNEIHVEDQYISFSQLPELEIKEKHIYSKNS